jgi:hypothetical protein
MAADILPTILAGALQPNRAGHRPAEGATASHTLGGHHLVKKWNPPTSTARSMLRPTRAWVLGLTRAVHRLWPSPASSSASTSSLAALSNRADHDLIHCRERVRVSNVAVDVGAHTAKVVQELAQAMLGVLGGLRVDGGAAGGGRDRSGSGEAGGEVSMVGVGNQQVERAGARLPALADRLGGSASASVWWR